MSPDDVDAEQATLETFTEPSVRDVDRADQDDADRDRERPDRGADPEQCVDPEHLERIDERLAELEQLVPGVDGVASEWERLTRSEKEATVLARLVRLKIHVDDALPDDEPTTASRGFQ